MRLVDAHIHLSDPEYEPHIDKVVEEAKKSSIVALLSNSTDLRTSLQSITLAERYPNFVYAALGIHPWTIKQLLPNELEQTVDLILRKRRHPGVVAIGEIGLDHKYAGPRERELMTKQYEVFCRMLELSEKLSLPAVIHSREATLEIVDMLASYDIKKVLLHWYSTPIELLPAIADRGYYISEGPPTLYSSHIQEIVRHVSLTRLLTETDGPVRYFRPPFKGKMTTPAFIPQVIEAIAKVKGQEESEVAEQIFQNFTSLFKKGHAPDAN